MWNIPREISESQEINRPGLAHATTRPLRSAPASTALRPERKVKPKEHELTARESLSLLSHFPLSGSPLPCLFPPLPFACPSGKLRASRAGTGLRYSRPAPPFIRWRRAHPSLFFAALRGG